jgi:iron complex outermembrane receptor protein
MSLLAPLCVFAQDSDEDLEELQGFTVTGSRIKSLDVQPLNPVIVYDADYISKTGARNIQDILDELPQNQLGLTDREVFGFTTGATGANLRGAGVQYTLTLLNGRRATSYGRGAYASQGFVNTGAIPLAAIDRIEILTDGASAIYGADAVTGVVNYVLKDNYEGLEVSGSFQNTFDTDTTAKNLSAVVGTVSNKSSSMFIVNYETRNALFARDRAFSKSSDQSGRGGIDWPNYFGTPYGSPATILDLSTGLEYMSSPEPYDTADLLTRTVQDENGDNKPFAQLREEFGTVPTQPTDYMGLAPEYSSVAFYGTSKYEVSDNLQVFMEAGFSRMEILNTVHPVAFDSERDLFDAEGTPLKVSKYNPYNPLGVNRTDGGEPTDIHVFNRNFIVGNRTSDITNDVLRFVAGVEGTFLEDFEYTVSGLYMTDHSVNLNGGASLRAATVAALTTADDQLMDPLTSWNIFGKFTGGPLGGDDNNAAVTPALSANVFSEYETKLYMANADVTGPLFDTPMGLVQFAAGAEIREEEWTDRSDAALSTGGIIGRGGVGSSDAWRRVKSAYIELSIPVYEDFVAQVAARYESFSGDTGDNLSPKVGFKYRPADWIVLRGSWSEGFRAPSLQELFSGVNVSFRDAGNDPYRDDEAVASVRTREVGNPLLEPEESTTKFIGIGFEPSGILEGLYVNVDWFAIDIENRIEGERLQDLIDINDDRVVRGDPTPDDISKGWLGKIIELNDFSKNKALMTMESLDFTVGYRFSHDTAGEFDFRLVGSYAYSRKTQNDADSDKVENAGTWQEPEWRVNLDGTWTKGDFTVFGSVNFIDKYEQLYYGFWGLDQFYVEEYVTLDLGVTYSGFWGMDLTAQIINVFDELPPMSTADQTGYDYLHSPYGRMYRLGFRREF